MPGTVWSRILRSRTADERDRHSKSNGRQCNDALENVVKGFCGIGNHRMRHFHPLNLVRDEPLAGTLRVSHGDIVVGICVNCVTIVHGDIADGELPVDQGREDESGK